MSGRAITIQNDQGTVRFSDQVYLYLSPNRKVVIERSQDYAGIIVDGKNHDFARMVIQRIRGNFKSEIYLKPILILNGTAHREPFLRQLIDGTLFSFDQLELVNEHLELIRQRIKDLNLIHSLSIEAQIITKLLAYLYTREIKELEPIPYVYSSTNYTFPFIACHYPFDDQYKIFEVMKIAQDEGLFTSDFFDRTYSCSNCNTAHLNYREVCPQCQSPNSVSEEVLHHFPCAYVGPISDFTNDLDDQLDCPKCSRRLKHIGVDYDKPSILHTCQKCSNRYQDFNVFAKCVSCSYENPVELLIANEVRSYRLTKKGEYSAINGFASTPKDIEQIIGTVKYDTFKTMVKYEIERLKQTEGASNIVSIQIINAGQFYSKISREMQKSLLRDIVSEIRSSIRSSDMITFYSSSTILISMNEIPTRIAERITAEILELLRALIKNNFTDLTIQLESNVRQLNYKLSSDLQIDLVIQSEVK